MIHSLNMSNFNRHKWLRRALFFLGMTFLYNLIEAFVSIYAGEVANSVALIGFGFDSVIEAIASGMAFWLVFAQLRNRSLQAAEAAEMRLQKFVGFSFLALSVYVTVRAAWIFWAHAIPHESFLGIGISIASVIIMPILAWFKLQVARQLESKALIAEAKETIACTILSVILLVGLGLNAWLGWWWADPLAALLMIPWLVREGLEGIKGEACCE